MVTKAKSSEHCGQVMMPTVAKPDEITDTLKAPTLNDKTALIKKMAESKVSLDADAVPVHSVPHPHAAHSRPSIPGLPCPIHSRAIELAVHMTILLTPCRFAYLLLPSPDAGSTLLLE